MSRTLAVVLGGTAGTVALVGIVAFLIYFCLYHKRSVSNSSDSGSSHPSVQAARHVGIELSLREARRFDMEELSMATKNFDEKNRIGFGKFGEVYKGLLQDGMLVAVKKRSGAPTQEFVDEVADAGLLNILGRSDVAGSSSQAAMDDIFLAPEVTEFRRLSEKSDIYSFGVFLLELVSGREAAGSPSPESDQTMVEWLQSNRDYSRLSNTIIDRRLGSSFTVEGMEEFLQLIMRCVNPSSERRPAMSYVVMELDRILEKEMTLTTVMGEGMPSVTLGSQLFR